MTAGFAAAVLLYLAWVASAELRARSRWREAERLSRCLFAAAGMRRRWR